MNSLQVFKLHMGQLLISNKRFSLHDLKNAPLNEIFIAEALLKFHKLPLTQRPILRVLQFRTGDYRDVDGKTIIEATKAGAIWVNVRRAMNVHSEYKELLDQMYAGIAKETGNKTFNANGGILISSPIAKVPYHFDKTETILWHVRGAKRIYLYPRTEEFIPDHAYEATMMTHLEDDLPTLASLTNTPKLLILKRVKQSLGL